MLEEQEVELFHHYKNKGRELAADGDIEGALRATQKAYNIHPNEKLKKRINKMQEFLQETLSGDFIEPQDKDVILKGGFHVSKKVYQQLYPYQKEGVEWLWGLHQKKKGGVLGDDMGLGKTIQIIALLSGLFESNLVKHALIIMPVSLIVNWNNEFLRWNPDIRVLTFHSETKSQRERNLSKIQRTAGVLITSYGMVVSNVDLFKSSRGRAFVWDYIVLDEGHKIKNPTKTTKAIHEIPAKHRLVLTGTPIQNNLQELWALYDFCHQGALLGSLPTFKMQYATIITRSREKNATSGERKLGNMMADSLKQLIAPYFLRRTKQEVLQQQHDKENVGPGEQPSKKISKLPQKNDLIVWLHLSDVQIQIYDDFVKTDQVKDLLMTKKSPLVALTVLKKICDHPRLLSKRACLQLGMNGEISQEELEEMLADEETHSPSIDVDHEILLKESGKLSVLIELLDRLRKEGHRTLVFSQSRKMLDIINNILLGRNWNVLRLDGTIKKLNEREDCVKRFQKTNMYQVMLLTTQVGGVGLTLTAADRVVIYDPSWNPATDSQAVDRAYRIGQTKPVVVYRLITCGTVEEKIYRRQIFKDSITRKTTGASKDPHRYFTNMELRELFQLDDPRFSSTQRQLQDMHSHQRLLYPELEVHLAYLHSLDIFGISDHDLMFQGNLKDHAAEDTNSQHDQEFIRSRVEKAKLILQMESEQAYNENIRSGTYCKDLTNFQKSRSTAVGQPTVSSNDDDVLEQHPLYNLKDDDLDILEASHNDDEELTEQEMNDLKNLSLTDSNFAKALDISLKEVDRRRSIKLEPFTSQFSNSEHTNSSTKSFEGVDRGQSIKVEPFAGQSSNSELTTSNTKCFADVDWKKPIMTETQCQFSNSGNDRSVPVDDTEDEDFKRAIELSLMETRSKSQEDKDLEEALEMSLKLESPSFHEDDEKDIHFALEESLKLYEQSKRHSIPGSRKSFVDLTNISMIDQDFAEALNASLRENNEPQRKLSTSPLKQEILVVNSDLDDSDDLVADTSLPAIELTTMLGMSSSKSFLESGARKVRGTDDRTSGVKSVDVIYETDEESRSSAANVPSFNDSSANCSLIKPITRKLGKYRLVSSESEGESMSSKDSEDGVYKKSRLTPEDELPDVELSSDNFKQNSRLSNEEVEEEAEETESNFSDDELPDVELSSDNKQNSRLSNEEVEEEEEVETESNFSDELQSCEETDPNSSLLGSQNNKSLFSEDDY